MIALPVGGTASRWLVERSRWQSDAMGEADEGRELPPRCAELRDLDYRVSFDVDCSELIAGHRFIARGLSDEGVIEHPGPDVSGKDHGYARFSLEYEFVPGIPAQAEDDELFDPFPRVDYTADVELPWEVQDGGTIAPFIGGPSTDGNRGGWPLPAGARVLTFTMFTAHPHAAQAGRLVVDLRDQAATWVPEVSD